MRSTVQKKFDPVTMFLGPGYSPCKIGDRVWVLVPLLRCTTKFGWGQVTKIDSPQFFLVDRMPRHVKVLRPHLTFITSEEDSNSSMASEIWSECLLNDDRCRIGQFAPGGSERGSRILLVTFAKNHSVIATVASLSHF